MVPRDQLPTIAAMQRPRRQSRPVACLAAVGAMAILLATLALTDELQWRADAAEPPCPACVAPDAPWCAGAAPPSTSTHRRRSNKSSRWNFPRALLTLLLVLC